MKKTCCLLLIIIFCSALSRADSGYRAEIYNCYISGNMAKWKILIDKMASEKSGDPAVIAELVNYQYGYIGWAIGNKKDDEAKKYLAAAEKNLEILKNHTSFRSIVNSYKSAFYGYKIALNKVLAPFLGGKSIECARNAISLDNSNYLAWVQLGNGEFYMPSAFGGSKKEALEYFLKAQNILESNPADIKLNWNYLSLLTVIAQACSYTGDFSKAKQYLDKILTIEPQFAWVKNELYQELYKKMNN